MTGISGVRILAVWCIRLLRPSVSSTTLSSEVQACHRVPNRSERSGQPGVFLIQFVSKATREKWLRLGKMKKLCSKDIVGTGENRVFFNESLTPFYRKLFYATKKLAGEKRYEMVCVLNGHIKVKKNREAREIIVIAGYEDLKRIV